MERRTSVETRRIRSREIYHRVTWLFFAERCQGFDQGFIDVLLQIIFRWLSGRDRLDDTLSRRDQLRCQCPLFNDLQFGKKKRISRSALTALSLPWTAFLCSFVPYKARILKREVMRRGVNGRNDRPVRLLLLRFSRVGRSDQFSPLMNGVVFGQHHGNDRPTDHKIDQTRKEFLAVMFAVEIGTLFGTQRHPSFLNR